VLLNMAVHTIKKGLDVPISGTPAQDVKQAPSVTRVAVMASDFIGMKPRMQVIVGDLVKRGSLLFEDRKQAGVFHTAPAAGKVVAINRGDKRAFQSLVIELNERELAGETNDEDHVGFQAYTGQAVDSLSADQVRALLVESGEWTALRARPFSRVPAVDGKPIAIFVNAMDTNPLAADPKVACAGREEDIQLGLDAAKKLVEKVYFCQAEGAGFKVKDADVHEFAGPHPSGLVGTHIHTLQPVMRGKQAWHLSVADLAAWGVLFRTGKLDLERIVAVAGPGVKDPALFQTRRGVSIDQLSAGNLQDGEQRIISGSILSGTIAMGEVMGFLGRYDSQISVLAEGREREFLGWLNPGLNKFSNSAAFLSKLFGSTKKFELNTSTNGSDRAMVPIGMYERVMPLDILPTFLLRSLISGDLEKAEALGMMELAEEDLALCTVVCPGKYNYGSILRRNLNILEAEG
jgi:Na+-transporting NADH:ubiquinone oxidoreductase subunit A